MSVNSEDNISDATLQSSVLPHLWVFSIDLIQLNAISHEPLEHNILE